jgi:hypothetical protein
VFPFAATPAVVQVEKAQAGGPIRLLTTDGSEVGRLKCSYERSSGLGGLPSSLALDLQPRTVDGSVDMKVRHGAEHPTQETWSAPLPALTTDVTITFSARNGTPALESVQATDEKGRNVCTIQVSPRGSGG